MASPSLENLARRLGLSGPLHRRTKDLQVERRSRSRREWLRRPEPLRLAGLVGGYAALTGAAMIWARASYLPPSGRVSMETRIVRTDFAVEDEQSTQKKREIARESTPRVYMADRALFDAIEASLARLPAALRDVQSLDQVAPDIREGFALSPETFFALRRRTESPEAAAAWAAAVRELVDSLKRTPILAAEANQKERLSPVGMIELRTWDMEPQRTHESQALSVSGDKTPGEILRQIRRAGFGPDVAPAVAARLARDIKPTFVFDEGETRRLQDAAAAAVRPEAIAYRTGDVLIRRGDTLTDARRDLLKREREAHEAGAGALARRWLERAGLLLVSCFAAVGMAAYTASFYPRQARRVSRAAGLAGLMALTAWLASWGPASAPDWTPLLATAPTVFLAMALSIAFGRRMAMALAGTQGMLVALGLGAPLGLVLVTLAGVGAAAWRLREVRHRLTIILAGVVTAGAMCAATIAVELADRPFGASFLDETLKDALLSGLGGLLPSFVALGLLPLIERLFQVVTGMTLMELRDPKQPLLRELAQRAPGTYTHSLTVATLAESAADAIGADGLHVYVGALYHDIGKINKPDYFVENSAGANRHEKLSPAMSLLVIVGHVKDGMELASAHSLPRSLRHYIESHHGTTLVEFFYQRAQEQAERIDGQEPQEVGFRYPGPKPQTKEAAILMLCDAVESASRAMGEPTPARIESLVAAISGMRLADGQFDECDLTLKDLHLIEQSIIKSLNSIYHARISYRSTESVTGSRSRPAAQGAALRAAEAKPAQPPPAPDPEPASARWQG